MLPGEVGTRAAVRLDDFFNADLAVTKNFRLANGQLRLVSLVITLSVCTGLSRSDRCRLQMMRRLIVSFPTTLYLLITPGISVAAVS